MLYRLPFFFEIICILHTIQLTQMIHHHDVPTKNHSTYGLPWLVSQRFVTNFKEGTVVLILTVNTRNLCPKLRRY